jgi:hypothetical protein
MEARMMRSFSKVVAVLSLLMSLVACQDKAKPDYDKCVEAETSGDMVLARDSCTAAIAADPNSTSGKAAAVTLADINKKFAEYEAGKAAKARAATPAAAEKAPTAADLRGKVRKKYWGHEPDGECTGKGLPPLKIDYEGGTDKEDEAVALDDGCQHLFASEGTTASRVFCCPK